MSGETVNQKKWGKAEIEDMKIKLAIETSKSLKPMLFHIPYNMLLIERYAGRVPLNGDQTWPNIVVKCRTGAAAEFDEAINFLRYRYFMAGALFAIENPEVKKLIDEFDLNDKDVVDSYKARLNPEKKPSSYMG